MRWFLRRLGFYIFATWVALTITFLLPRLMPGDPIGGILQHLSPAQVRDVVCGVVRTRAGRRRLAQLAAAVGWRRRLARSALDNALISLARPGTN